MSQEWLKQLAELSNDKDLRKRAQQMQKTQRTSVRQAGGRQRGLAGAAFGFFFRWLFLLALVEAVAMFVVIDSEGLQNATYGEAFHYLVWYPLTQPILPDEIYAGLQSGFGLTLADLSAFYKQINSDLVQYEEALVYAAPPAVAAALTLFFLPAINAKRRGSPIRFLVFLANLAVIILFKQLGQAVIALWLGAFLFSLAGGAGQRAPRQPRPQAATPQPQSRQASQPRRAARPEPAALLSRPSVVDRSSRTATPLNKREPAVVRHGTGSWVRGR